jgi:Cu-Zn family superoxide dismutase
MRRPRPLSFALSFSLCAPVMMQGCSSPEEAAALATLEPLAASDVRGTVEFTRVGPERIRIRIELSGLAPGLHGIHIHQYGDCSAPDGSSAGEHFNPDGSKHGGPAAPHHAGDMGNVDAGASGRATLELTTEDITLDDGPRGVMGRSLVVHAMADDLVTDPAGSSGARIACAVIRAPSGTTAPVLPGP